MCGSDKTVFFFWVISQLDHELQLEGKRYGNSQCGTVS